MKKKKTNNGKPTPNNKIYHFGVFFFSKGTWQKKWANIPTCMIDSSSYSFFDLWKESEL